MCSSNTPELQLHVFPMSIKKVEHCELPSKNTSPKRSLRTISVFILGFKSLLKDLIQKLGEDYICVHLLIRMMELYHS